MQISLSDQIWSGSKDAGCNVLFHPVILYPQLTKAEEATPGPRKIEGGNDNMFAERHCPCEIY